ncbi:MAG: ABC transporter ATP-binding protein [Pontibacterium sp.]
MSNVVFEKVEKVYSNGFKAVHGIDLEINEGEFMVFVGPSGCAKSTTLRMLAGLETITGGQVKIGGKVVNNLEPKDRGIAMVFQNYALYPHMTVKQNLGFGLKLAGLPKAEIEERVAEAAEILEITPLLDRLPRQLSGGQAQRVAVGRAIVKRPQVFLFDEPLSNLDAKLRASMRVRISDLHKQLRQSNRSATSVYVTHDQTEAMTMGDRICVLKDGRIMQVDTPDNLYKYPQNLFVAGFIGAPEMNLKSVNLELGDAANCYASLGEQRIKLSEAMAARLLANLKETPAESFVFGLRPEAIHLAVDKYEGSEVMGRVIRMENMGSEYFVYVDIDGHEFCARIKSYMVEEHLKDSVGKEVKLCLETDYGHIFDPKTEQNISL